MASVPERQLVYVVTAAHVVRPEAQTWVRFNRKDEGVADVVVPQWTFHPNADVAVSRVRALNDYRMRSVLVCNFVRSEHEAGHAEAYLGDRVYFIGLLARLAEMANANIPMVRGATLGRINQENVPIRLPDNTVLTLPLAHLIDCRSYAGFSGSPCFLQFDKARVTATGIFKRRTTMEHETVLLGLISGHFDDWERARVTGDIIGEVRTRINTGVGVVTPAAYIQETLSQPELAQERLQREREVRTELDQQAIEAAATADH